MNSFTLKICVLLCLIFGFAKSAQSQSAPKLIAECSITYSVSFEGSEKEAATTKKLFIKGKKTRTEIGNPSFYQATIFDNKTGNAVVLKEVGGNKYISSFTENQWKEKNSQWNNTKVSLTNETTKIANYVCRKAIITTQSGTPFTVYYTTDFIASATENPYQFKEIPGLILEYESQTKEGKSIAFKAINVNFNPVPASKFEIPVSGYRIIE